MTSATLGVARLRAGGKAGESSREQYGENYGEKYGWIAGFSASTLLVAAIAIGSRGFRDFDPALTHYTVVSVIACFAVAYRHAVWLSRPPTRRYLHRAFQLFRSGNLAGNGTRVAALAADGLGAQTFIARRSRFRWVMHLCLSWGSMLAFAITFPLVFGWVHFETPAADAETYRAMLFGLAVGEFSIHSWQAFLAFNALNFAAVMVLAGVGLALYRRLRDRGELAIQRFGNDVMPLLLLFSVAATGLLLTFSARALAGSGYPFLAVTHAATVTALLLYLPFGKLFHVFQRPAQLGVALYKRAGEAGPAAHCARCGAQFASAMHVADLKAVLVTLGMEPRFAGSAVHYQDICPGCRRRLVAIHQARLMAR